MDVAAPRFYNTLTRRLETFTATDPPSVGIYACGPTVYDHPHIGNFRYFVWVDLVHRYLRSRGHEVQLVMNLTDIDDRTIDGAAAAGLELDAFTGPFIDSFRDGLELLRVVPATEYPRATRHVAEMIAMIEVLLQGGHAYAAEGGVFFRVASFAGYGQLARLDPEDMRATERVSDDEFAKEDPRDFALWKTTAPGEPGWEAPFGFGRPGWHLECSAMSRRYLGDTFDLHLGGTDLIFPHHENEIAQSEACTGQRFVRHWMHCQHLIVDGNKMSKSLGNFRTLDQLVADGHDAVAIRYLLASVHYRRQLNFTDDALQQASAAVQRLRDTARRVDEGLASPGDASAGAGVSAALTDARTRFDAALADDLNTAGALGHLFTFVRELNAALDAGPLPIDQLAQVRDWFAEIDEFLAVFAAASETVEVQFGERVLAATGPPVDEALRARIQARLLARAERDFGRADSLRAELLAAGVEVEDTPDGGRWKRVRN